MQRQTSLWAALGALASLLLLLGSPTTAAADAPALYSFNNADDGAYPFASLIQGPDGSFYGTTNGDGNNNEGTVFKLTTDGTAAGTTLTTLVTFDGTNGAYPYAALILGHDGNFYGTTSEGGTYGTVFKMTTDGTAAGTTLTTLASFNYNDGAIPYGSLLKGSDGHFYGTASDGGSGNGTVFTLTTDGTAAGSTLTPLVIFDGTNGAGPTGTLIQGSDGSFYGTTVNGGGTVFKLTTDGTAAGTALTTLVSFNVTNGTHPAAGLIQGDDGNFYGTTYGGGLYNGGTVFKLTPAGSLRTLVNFNGANGSFPYAPLIQGSDRKFYGTTVYGGNGNGTVFAIDPRAIESVTFTPMTLAGGTSALGEVTLSHIATTDQLVTLTSSNPAVLPIRASVTITAGHRHALFTVSAKKVKKLTRVTITATLGGVSKYSTVRVTP